MTITYTVRTMEGDIALGETSTEHELEQVLREHGVTVEEVWGDTETKETPFNATLDRWLKSIAVRYPELLEPCSDADQEEDFYTPPKQDEWFKIPTPDDDIKNWITEF